MYSYYMNNIEYNLLWIFRDVHITDNIVKYAGDISVNYHKIGLTVNFDSEMCMFSNLVGNKAKSLFQLKKAIIDGLINDVSYVYTKNVYYVIRFGLLKTNSMKNVR